MKKLKISIDIDHTICISDGLDYANAKPITERIELMNRLYDEGHELTYWTARGSGTGIDHTELTKSQFEKEANQGVLF